MEATKVLGMYTSVAVAVVVAALVWAWALGVRRSRRRKRQGKDRICPLLPPLTAEEVEVLPGMVVCVTGGGGYVASHIVRRLLAAGATVRATVRDLGTTSPWGHLRALPGAAERLQVVQADLMQPASMRAAVAGCDAVVHTASPYHIALPPGKEREAVVEPALKGTRAVLEAVGCEPRVTTLVVTSSVAAVWVGPWEKGRGHVFTEDDWCSVACDPRAADGPLAYFYAKAAAERLVHAAATTRGLHASDTHTSTDSSNNMATACAADVDANTHIHSTLSPTHAPTLRPGQAASDAGVDTNASNAAATRGVQGEDDAETAPLLAAAATTPRPPHAALEPEGGQIHHVADDVAQAHVGYAGLVAGVRVVSILAGAVWGPPLSGRRDGESVGQMMKLMTGGVPVGAPPVGAAVVDVRDVAAAHCAALARPHARGRYLLASRPVYPLPLAAKVLRASRPHLALRLPWLLAPRWACLAFGPALGLPAPLTRRLYGRKPAFSTARAAHDLGMTSFLQPEQAVSDMADAMEVWGLV